MAKDRLPAYLRRSTFADKIPVRLALRSSAVVLLALGLVHALSQGGHLDDPRSPLYNLEGRIAGAFGQAAQHISITGLKHHDARAVLAAIGVKSGGSLIGFEAERARRLLENLDWIKKARLAKIHPNRLRIDIVEREPIALWQTDGMFYPVDDEGVAIASLDPGRFARLPVVTGEGANTAAKALVNHLEAHPRIRSSLRAAARVGMRRWNLYFATGLKVLLPEKDLASALDRLERLDVRHGVLGKAIEVLDLRQADRLVLRPQAVSENAGDAG